MSAQPLETLELQALEERKHLHDRANELKERLVATRDKLDPRRNAREHFVGVAIAVSMIGLFCGYSLGRIFTND